LRLFGAKIGAGTSIYPSARIWAPWNLEMGDRSGIADGAEIYNVDKIVLEEEAIVSQFAFLCTASHDITDPGRRLMTAPIHLGRQAWVCAAAYVGMGVTVAEGAVVAARAVAVKDVAPWTVVGGNPARFIKQRVLAPPSDQA
jgi:putative colanic acid biosynthesis acetyltransferase WcaF